MASAFTLLPMSQDISLEAGDTYEGKITVSNPADSTDDFRYLVEVSPYSVSGEDYAADFSDQGAHNMIADWITIEKPQGVLRPNESRDVYFTISAPSDAPGGGQYAAITVRSNPETNTHSGASVQNIFQMASIIYADIKGETTHAGEIVSSSIPAFSTTTPVFSAISLTNHGNIHEKAITTITVKNVFSGEQIFPVDDEDNVFVEYVMPGSSRYLTRSIDRLAPLGVYQVEQKVEYLGETSFLSQTLITCPIWFLFLVMATIACLIVTIVSIFRHKNKLKRELI